MESPEENGWGEWKRLVLSELKALKEGQKEAGAELQAVRVDMAVLKTKAGVWGAIAGAIPVAIGMVWYALTGRKP